MKGNSYAVEIPLEKLKPYEKNPRDNSASIDKVAESIKAFDFLQPIVCDADGVILAGHTRYAAATKLGMRTVPVLFANNLSPAQAKAYRIADNKVAESSKWNEELLLGELQELAVEAPEFVPADFGFEPFTDMRRRRGWAAIAKKCNLEPKLAIRARKGYMYASFTETSEEGQPLEELKGDQEIAQAFADILADYLLQSFGSHIARGEWCICTTPRRRHREGFHFATEICRQTAAAVDIPFYEDVAVAKNRRRITPSFELKKKPKEKNVILFDDIITTGVTLGKMRSMLLAEGYVVFPVVGIRNE